MNYQNLAKDLKELLPPDFADANIQILERYLDVDHPFLQVIPSKDEYKIYTLDLANFETNHPYDSYSNQLFEIVKGILSGSLDPGKYLSQEEQWEQTKEEMLSSSLKFRYQMLNRLEMDCHYYLDAGQRQSKVLWAGNVEQQVELMYAIWNSFPENQKPEWLPKAEIEQLHTQMNSASIKLDSNEITQSKLSNPTL